VGSTARATTVGRGVVDVHVAVVVEAAPAADRVELAAEHGGRRLPSARGSGAAALHEFVAGS
jgi:hypothetical protein